MISNKNNNKQGQTQDKDNKKFITNYKNKRQSENDNYKLYQ